MYDLTQFNLSTMAQCSSSLRSLGNGAATLVEAADRIVRFLFENLVNGAAHDRSCALVRFYKTHPLGQLEPDLKVLAKASLGPHASAESIRCLTLMASAGELPEWNDRTRSKGHRVIPLPSAEVVNGAPMISQLIRQLGLDINTVLQPDPALLLDLEQRAYNIFFVPEAAGSPFVPAQDFVTQHGIKSVLGFGGVLATGDLFAVIMFSKVAVPRDTALLFKTLALGVKVTIVPFARDHVFA